MKKNIKQNFFRQIKHILDKVDKVGDNAKHFRCIMLMGDQQEQRAYSYIHAPQEDMESLILSAMRHSEEFVAATANAFMQYNAELEEKQNLETQNNNNNEENPIRED